MDIRIQTSSIQCSVVDRGGDITGPQREGTRSPYLGFFVCRQVDKTRIWIVESTSRSHGIYTMPSLPALTPARAIEGFGWNVHVFITRAEQIMLRTQDIYTVCIYTGAGGGNPNKRKNKRKTDDAEGEKRWKRLKATTCPRGNREAKRSEQKVVRFQTKTL